MALPDKAILSRRIKQTDYYIENFPKAFGLAVFSDDDTLLAAVAASLAAFQNAEFFNPFDSKYDRYLRGDYELTGIEESGRSIFFSSAKSNCSSCHQLEHGNQLLQPFSNFGYYNIGVPINQLLRSKNGLDERYRDVGMARVSGAVNSSERGRFKVPGLRNVAVTSPYMHNGVFRRLRTVLEFHDKYNNPARRINSETQLFWLQPEIGEWIDSESLDADALENKDIEALLAFLKLLTDRRYEKLTGD
jgi:cytochrome c peroxidase